MGSQLRPEVEADMREMMEDPRNRDSRPPEDTWSITCPVCGMTSHHPMDVDEGYCGNCHDWTGAR